MAANVRWVQRYTGAWRMAHGALLPPGCVRPRRASTCVRARVTAEAQAQAQVQVQVRERVRRPAPSPPLPHTAAARTHLMRVWGFRWPQTYTIMNVSDEPRKCTLMNGATIWGGERQRCRSVC